ncbi:carotenoid biosynthesis protein [Demequina rhizosphaerae]|uniref:carotenoid biosynthesis protein n=1 Tax=Demequina rhizosphaerae TaxID=1638985 RepID=UPI000783B378|nr:carotenoid biosynthesis protein [Demequina rhizosphaerae]
MIFGTPVSWFLFEVLSVVVFVATLIHATRRPAATRHVLTLLGFVIFAATFENIGVWQHIYDYSTDRIMMIGNVPLSILFVEAVGVYCALWVAEHLRLPWWVAPFLAGLWGSIQDMTVDPSNVFDLHTIDGVASGQWNWTMSYDGGFFGIPVFNFSGWFTMILYYCFAVALIQRLAEHKDIGWLRTGGPLVAILPSLVVLVSPINLFLLYGWPLAAQGTLVAESTMLVVNLSVAAFLVVRYAKLDRPLDLKRDWIVFAVPVVLHLWDIGLAFAAQIEIAYVPSVLFTAIHVAALAVVVRAGLRARARLEAPEAEKLLVV